MYQKCVCFLFLVILAILSCSGYRIDNLAMTDLNKKYPEISSNSDRHLREATVHRPHRIRHHRLWRNQAAHNRNLKPHIDAIVYPPNEVNSPKTGDIKFVPEELRFPPDELRIPHARPNPLKSEVNELKSSSNDFKSNPLIELGQPRLSSSEGIFSRLFPIEVRQSRLPSSEVKQPELSLSEVSQSKLYPNEGSQSRLSSSGVSQDELILSRSIRPVMSSSEAKQSSPYSSNIKQSRLFSSELGQSRITTRGVTRPAWSPSEVNRDRLLRSEAIHFGVPSSEVIRPEKSSSTVSSTQRHPHPWPRLSAIKVTWHADEVKDELTSPTLFPSESLAQIPPTDLVPNSRPHRSSRTSKNKKKAEWSSVQKEDFLGMARQVEYVVLAVALSKNPNEPSCSGYFRVKTDYKNNTEPRLHRQKKLVTMDCDKAKKLQLQTEYLLLLDGSFGLKQYRKSPKKLFLRKMRRLDNKRFVVTKPQVISLNETQKSSNSKNRVLICEVKGRPIPRITWWRKNEILSSRKPYRIKYKKRKSKLTIRNATPDLMGEYSCRAENLNGQVDYKNISLSMPTTLRCLNKYEGYCQNGGTCLYENMLNEPYCSCAEGFSGERCENKVPDDTSTYTQPNLYSCQLGLSTKYNCQN